MCILLSEPELFLKILCCKNQKFNKDTYANLVKDVICHRPNILQLLLEQYNKEHIPSLAPYLFKYYARENEDLFNNFISQHDPEILKQDKLTNILIKRAYDIDFIENSGGIDTVAYYLMTVCTITIIITLYTLRKLRIQNKLYSKSSSIRC